MKFLLEENPTHFNLHAALIFNIITLRSILNHDFKSSDLFLVACLEAYRQKRFDPVSLIFFSEGKFKW